MRRRPFAAALLLALALTALGGGGAMARISKKTVEAAWQRVFPYAQVDAPDGPIIYEEDREPNAWVSSHRRGYSVHVTRGLMDLLDREDQIAGIMGHELGHIKLGHFRQSLGRKLLWGVLAIVAVDQVDDAWLLLPAGVGAALAEAGFSRQQEVAADDFGVRVASQAGYDPWGLYQAISRMKEAGFKTSRSGFNSHPPTARRLDHIKAQTQKYIHK